MNLTILLLIAISIIFTIRNVVLFRKLRGSKDYKAVYHSVVSREDNIIEKLNAYIEKEKDEYYKHKGILLLIYQLLQNDQDVDEALNNIDMHKIFMPNGKYNKNHINLNSDMFIWLMVMFPRLNKLNKEDKIFEKFNDLDSILSNHLEYRTFKAAYYFIKKDEENSKFLSELINGEYIGMIYDKQLIGVSKRIALSYIASTSKEQNIEYKDELALFSKSYIGSNLLKDLDIYEVYKADETN